MADEYTFKDAGGNTKTHAAKEVSSGVFVTKHIPVDLAGTEIYFKGTAILATAVIVTTTAGALPASALANRRSLTIRNNGAAIIYLGSAAVTTSVGFPLGPGESFTLEVGALAVYGRVASGTVEVRVLEVS